VAFEQGFKHGARDDVLRQHLDGVAFADGVVQVVAHFGKEGLEGAAFLGVGSFSRAVRRVMWFLAISAMSACPILPIIAGARIS
jgi:hypothetical protein